ncbi:MAG: hypothetical protein JKX88_00420 [Marinicaulis sp.]|nr:hypothetical protein [Marinicaulis sp.]
MPNYADVARVNLVVWITFALMAVELSVGWFKFPLGAPDTPISVLEYTRGLTDE